MALGQVLLGILADGPAHGYDIKRMHDARFPGTRPLAYGQVYATLSKLEADGLVEVAETHQGSGPERTVYALTTEGDAALRSWLDETENAGPYSADELVRKTVTALLLGTDAAGFLRRQRTTHLEEMRQLVDKQAALKDTASRIAIDHTISHLDADLRWLETAAERVAADRRSK